MENVNPPGSTAGASESRLIARSRILGRFLSAQVLAQGLGVASGILLVRTLDHREYAFFTIANSMQSMMNILADTGLSIGLSSIGGKVWSNRHRFGQLITTTMRLRRYLAAVAALVVTPVLCWMLINKGSSYGYAAAMAAILLAGLYYQLTTGVLIVVPRFLSQIRRIQLLDVSSAAVRLLFVCIAYFIFLNAATAALATVIMFASQHLLLKRWAPDGIDVSAPPNEDDRRVMLGIVRSLAPNAVFYCLQGQLSVFLLTFFGSAKSVAEIGALGRLAVMFSVIGSVMSSIILPRFARYQSHGMLKLRYLQVTGGFVLFGTALVVASVLIPGPLLWILGGRYALLHQELRLMMILTALNAVGGAMWALNSSKGWIGRAWLNIPGTLVAQAVLLTFLDVSTIWGALLLGILSSVPSLLLNIGLATSGLRSVARQG